MNDKDQLTADELKRIFDATTLKKDKVNIAERAVLEAKNAELAHQVTVQHIFLKYGLSFDDKIDDSTGIITRVKSGLEETGKGE
jgi:hypothetical protein